MDNSTARERQRVAIQVARYQREPTALEHERLLPLVEKEYGPLAAEFFDQEGCLPLASRIGPGNYPWPMRQAGTFQYAMSVLMVSLVTAFVVGWALVNIINIVPAALIGIASGFAVWFAASPVIGRFFPPQDLPERQRLVQAFAEIQKRYQRAAESEAERNRQTRWIRRIAQDGNPQ